MLKFGYGWYTANFFRPAYVEGKIHSNSLTPTPTPAPPPPPPQHTHTHTPWRFFCKRKAISPIRRPFYWVDGPTFFCGKILVPSFVELCKNLQFTTYHRGQTGRTPGPQHKKSYLRTCAHSEDSDQTAHSRSLIRIFAGPISDSQAYKVSSCGQRRLWSDCVDAQVDLSLWVYMPLGMFSHVAAHSSRKQAYSNILKISPPKTETFQIKKLWYFLYFCSKHRLWVPVRTPSAMRF